MKQSRHFAFVLFVVTLAVLLVPAFATAQCMGGGIGSNTFFDPQTITTYSGTLVQEYSNWSPWGNGNHTGGGMHYSFQTTTGETFDLMLAPYWFLADNGIELEAGDTLTVTGSVVDAYMGGNGYGGGRRHGDDDYIIVTEISYGGITLVLRDERGYPVWSGGGANQWFDPSTVQTIRGTFTENLGFWSCWGNGNFTGNGMHMIFTAQDDTEYYAMLGPWWYLQEQGLVITDGMSAKITGSVVEHYYSGYSDYDYIIATEITAGGVTVKLRDENGVPLWWGTGWHYYAPTYEKSTSGTVSGTVMRVRVRSNGTNLDPGYEAIVKSGSSRYRVFFAPEWHAKAIGFSLKKGQEISISGSVLTGKNSKKDLVVRQAKVGGTTYRFRTSDGTPRWITGAK